MYGESVPARSVMRVMVVMVAGVGGAMPMAVVR